MTLRLALKHRSSVPVEVEGVTPEAVRDKGLADIEQLGIFHGNTKVPLAEFFAVSGDSADGRMEWEGDLSGVHWIGAGMGVRYLLADAHMLLRGGVAGTLGALVFVAVALVLKAEELREVLSWGLGKVRSRLRKG